MTDRLVTTLGDLLRRDGGSIKTGPFGTTLKAAEYSEEGVPLISVGEVGHGHLRVRADTPRAPKEVVDRLPEYVLEEGDIVFGRKGAVDRSAWVKPEQAGWFLGSDGVRLRLPLTCDSRFVAYQLQAVSTRKWIRQHATGTTMASLNQTILGRLPIVVPPLIEQRGIAGTLAALDDKLESNRRLLRGVLDLITAEMRAATVDTNVVPVTRLARFVNGGAFTKDATGSGRMVLRIAELNSGPGASTVYTERDVPEEKTARAGDLLMSWSGSLDIYRWTRDEAIINQHIFKVIPRDAPAWLVHDRLKEVMPIFQSIAKDKATTMGHIQRGHLESTTVPMPSSEQIARLDARLGPLWDRPLLAEREIHTLEALRDALLPELVSGRIRVPEGAAG
jgi:type I restriction enzyme S subunit